MYSLFHACLCHIWSIKVTLGHLLSVFKGHVRPFFLLVMKFLWNMLDVLRLESFGVYQVIWAKPILGFITKSVKVRVEKLWRDRCWWRRNGCWRCHQHIWSQNDFVFRTHLISSNKGECSTGQSCGLYTNIFTGNPIHSCTNCIPSGLQERKMILTCPPGNNL